MPEITREQARDIAINCIEAEPGNGLKVNKVLAWNEITFAKPSIYYHKPFDVEKCWIVYLDDPETDLTLKSSAIMIISQDFGEIFYYGTANDEE
jgi:hypothetical protein